MSALPKMPRLQKPQLKFAKADRFTNLWNSLSFFAFALAASVCGITLAAVVFGPQSTEYYIVAAATLPFAIMGLIRLGRVDRQAFLSLSILCTIPIVFVTLQTFYPVWYAAPPSFMTAFAMSAVIMIAASAASLQSSQLRASMAIISIVHIILCLYGFNKWSPEIEGERFSSLDVHTAVWGELAFGAVLAAIVTGKNLIIAAALVSAAPIIVSTQMRGVGLAVFAAFAFHLISLVPRKYAIGLSLFGLLLFMAASLYMDEIIGAGHQVLLLSDPHRGIDAGFSGRFENWSSGLELFMESPFIGAGIGNPIIRDTHNGIIMAFAELGIIGGLAFTIGLVWALACALRNGLWTLFSVIAGYVIFIQSAPRYVNLSSCVIIGLAASVRAFLQARGSTRSRKMQHSKVRFYGMRVERNPYQRRIG